MTDEDYEQIIAGALVDCYDITEQIAGFGAFIQDKVVVPLRRTIANIKVKVVDFTNDRVRVLALVEDAEPAYPVDVVSITFETIPLCLFWLTKGGY